MEFRGKEAERCLESRAPLTIIIQLHARGEVQVLAMVCYQWQYAKVESCGSLDTPCFTFYHPSKAPTACKLDALHSVISILFKSNRSSFPVPSSTSPFWERARLSGDLLPFSIIHHHERKYHTNTWLGLFILLALLSLLRLAWQHSRAARQGLRYLLVQNWRIVVSILLQDIYVSELAIQGSQLIIHCTTSVLSSNSSACCILRICNNFVPVSLYVSFLSMCSIGATGFSLGMESCRHYDEDGRD